jgi:hypothetical protein
MWACAQTLAHDTGEADTNPPAAATPGTARLAAALLAMCRQLPAMIAELSNVAKSDAEGS